MRWAGPPWAQTPRKRRIHAWRPRGVHRSASASLLCLHHLQTGSNTAQRGAQHRACPEPASVSSHAHRCGMHSSHRAQCQSPTPKRHTPPRARTAGGAGAGLTLPPDPQQLRAQLGQVPGTVQASPEGLFQPGSGRTCGAGALVHLLLCRGPLWSHRLTGPGRGFRSFPTAFRAHFTKTSGSRKVSVECLQPWDPAHPGRAYRACAKEPRRRLVRWGTAGPGDQTGRRTSGNCQGRGGNAPAALDGAAEPYCPRRRLCPS